MKDSPTLADLLDSAQPEHPAIILPEDGSVTTYRQLSEQVDRLARALSASGLQPGQTVGIVLPNGLENVAIFLAITRARLIAAPFNPAYKVDEFRFSSPGFESRALIVAPGGASFTRCQQRNLGLLVWTASRNREGRVVLEGVSAPALGATLAASPTENDIAMFLHTSGTTSRPKGVPLTHGNLMASIRNIAGHYRLSPADTGLVVMPLFHVHGLMGATLSSLWAGATLVVPSRFSAQTFWPAVKAHRVNWYSAVPTIHQILLQRADSDGAPTQPGLRFIRSCSSALAPATMAQLEARFNAPVLEAYAMTEASHQMTSNPLPPAEHKPGSVGQGTNVEVAIMDEQGNLQAVSGTPGEVVIRGANVTRGYHNNPDANESAFTNGWFRTGDRGVLDAEGYLTLIGRIKELINRGGEKITPLEIDAVLLSSPGRGGGGCLRRSRPQVLAMRSTPPSCSRPMPASTCC